MVTLLLIMLIYGIIVLAYGCCTDSWKSQCTGLVKIAISLVGLIIVIAVNINTKF